jgi:hypothetical protein
MNDFLTCTHTFGFSSSLTSASCIAARAWSNFPDRLKVAALINHNSLSSLRSFLDRSLFSRGVVEGGGNGGGDSGRTSSLVDA